MLSSSGGAEFDAVVAGDVSAVGETNIFDEPVTKKLKLDSAEQLVESEPAETVEVVADTSISITKRVNPAHQYRQDLKRVLSKNEELSKYFAIKANGSKLVMLQGNHGDAPYRHHPSTIRELNDYFNQLAQASSSPSSFNYCQFLRQGHLPLVAKLVQDSQKPTAELIGELKEILLPLGSQFSKLCEVVENKSENTMMNAESSTESSSSCTEPSTSSTTLSNAQPISQNNHQFINHHFLNEFFEKTNYGHPSCTTPFSAWSCTFWQCRDMAMLGPELTRHFLVSFVMRQAGRMILEGALQEISVVDVGEAGDVVVVAEAESAATEEVAKVEAKKKRRRTISTTTSSSSNATTTPAPTTPSKSSSSLHQSPTKPSASPAPLPSSNKPAQPQISAFFSKLERKKDAVSSITPGEYFQPFFLKPGTTLAPINSLRTGQVAVDYSAQVTQLRRASIGKIRCLCVGIDGVASRAVLKLLRFEENYRPAYVGTWRRSGAPALTPRRPTARIEAVDYEWDSDEEWEEGEGEEGESLSSDEEEDEESETEYVLSSNESEDSWLVPHGYLSEDEGVADEIHPGELEEKEAMAMPPSAQSQKKRKKFIPKEPVVLIPGAEALNATVVQFVTEGWAQRNPFEGYLEAVFEHLMGAGDGKAKMIKEFPENLLSSLIKVILDNQMSGIVKLYDEFTLQNGKTVSKRAFEAKLNQITQGKQKCPSSGKMKWILKDGIVPN